MIAIENGKIIMPDKIIENKTLLIDNGRIKDIADNSNGAEQVIDAHGRYIAPGLIDVHSDKIEQFIQPRPTSQMDFELALKECERELLHLGITTMYHSLSLYKDEFFGKSPLKTKESVQKIADLILETKGFSVTLHKLRSTINKYKEKMNLLTPDDVRIIITNIEEWKKHIL